MFEERIEIVFGEEDGDDFFGFMFYGGESFRQVLDELFMGHCFCLSMVRGYGTYGFGFFHLGYLFCEMKRFSISLSIRCFCWNLRKDL